MNASKTRNSGLGPAERRFGAWLLAWLCVAEACAEVTLDGSLGPAGAVSGPDYRIGADLGRLVGGNLFHSFGRFGLSNGESATFSGPASVENIIGRVTGGELSRIDGLLRSSIPGANLFLLNPSGIAFGPNARLDIKGSFHAATADYLRFGDGGRFGAAPSAQDAVLSVAAPQAFGFLQDRPQGVSLDHSRLETPAGAALTLAGGDIDAKRASLATTDGHLQLIAAGRGEVDLAGQTAVAGGGAVRLDNAELSAGGTGGQGIAIRGGRFYAKDSTLETAHAGGVGQTADGASIRTSESIVLDGSKITVRALDAGASGAATISTDGDLTASNSLIRTLSGILPGGLPAPGARADAGDVVARGRTVSLSEQTALLSAVGGAGKTGRVSVEAEQLDMVGAYIYNQSGFFVDAVPAAGGGARDVDLRVRGAANLDNSSVFQTTIGPVGQRPAQVVLQAGDLNLSNGTRIYNSALALSGDGLSSDGGDVHIVASGSVALSGSSFVSTDAGLGGKSGAATIEAGGNIVMRDKGYVATFGGDPARLDPQAGAVTLQAGGDISIGGFSAVVTSSDLTGSSGAISLRAGGDILFKAGYLSSSGVDRTQGVGQSGAIRLQAGKTVALTEDSVVIANSWGNGQAGDIAVESAEIRANGSSISSESGNPLDATRNSGTAGNIALRATDRIEFVDAFVSSATYGHGRGGNVTMTAGALSMTDSFAFSDSGARSLAIEGNFVSGVGDAGTVSLKIAGEASMLRSWLSTDTYGDGMAGQVLLNAGSATLADGSFITSKSLNPQGLGSAGDISLTLAQTLKIDGSYLRSDTSGAGHAGDIAISAGTGVELTEQSSLSSETRGAGNGGALSVETPGDIVLRASTLSSNTYGAGAAGNIVLRGAGLTMSDTAIVASGSGVSETGAPATGDGGAVDIRVMGALSLNGSFIVSQTQGEGEAGTVALQADALTMDRQSVVSASSLGRFDDGVFVPGNGDANTISVGARHSVSLAGGSYISSTTDGAGHGGDILIDAGRGVSLRQGSYVASSSFGAGPGGDIALNARRFSLTEGGYLTSASQGAGDGGDMTIRAERIDISGGIAVPEGVTLLNGVQAFGLYSGLYLNSQGGSGRGGNLRLSAQDLNVSQGGVVGSVTVFGDGDAGDLDIRAGNLRLTGGGLIANSTSGAGDAGRLQVRADTLFVSGRLSSDRFPGFLPRSSLYSGIDSSSTYSLNAQADSLGDGGHIRIDARELDIADRGRIATATEAEGRGGDIVVRASVLRLSGGGGLNAGSLGADAGIEANPDLGHSGNIDVSAEDSIRIAEGGAVTVATRRANAGAIALRAGNLLSLRDGGRIATSAAGGQGNGGNIEISAPVFVLESGSALVARALFGHGGDIEANSNYFQAAPDSTVDASSRFGVGGQVRIDSPVSYISGSLAVLPANLMDASRLAVERCADRAPAEEGRGGRVGLNGLRRPAWGPDDPLTDGADAPGEADCGLRR